MPHRLRVLLVEDRPQEAAYLEKACRDAVQSREVLVEVAGDAASAFDLLDGQHFDLAVCDLAIPGDRLSMARDRDHGMSVLTRIRRDHGGIPTIVLSDYADDPELLRLLLHDAAKGDPYGLRGDFPLLLCTPKESLLEGIRQIAESLQRSSDVATVPIGGSGAAELSAAEARTIQIFARRWGGAAVEIDALPGGHSDSKTLRVQLLDEDAEPTALVVAKLGTRERVHQEAAAFQAVSMRLPPEVIVPLTDTVDAGAGGKGGAFYTLAGNYDRDLFECLSEPAAASAAAGALREILDASQDTASQESLSVLQIRREIVRYTDASSAGSLAATICSLDDRELSVARCLQHGDLHGQNVLVSRDRRPMLIDYADVRPTLASLDPVTLELSTIFHPGATAVRGSWPTEVQASQWADLDVYTEACPFADYIRECRDWANEVAASPEEVDAVVISYVLRQLQFQTCPQDLAAALIRQAAERLR